MHENIAMQGNLRYQKRAGKVTNVTGRCEVNAFPYCGSARETVSPLTLYSSFRVEFFFREVSGK